MTNHLDEPAIKAMIDAVYGDDLIVGHRNCYEEPVEDTELNVAPIFCEMCEAAHLADGYRRLHMKDEKDESGVWLFSWSEEHKAAYVGAKALGCIFPEWTGMRWLELAERMASGELNDLLTEWGYEFLRFTPLPVDDHEHVSWI